jgi:hypothetical protein
LGIVLEYQEHPKLYNILKKKIKNKESKMPENSRVYDASAVDAVSVTVNTATLDKCRAVWVGTTQSLDFTFDGTTWIEFQGATAGTVIPIQVIGARKNAASAAPDAGDVVFLY